MRRIDYVGPAQPSLVLYLPHRPNGLSRMLDQPDAGNLIATNSNHWRKIVTLLAKVASPTANDWRDFRDTNLFQQTGLCFAPELVDGHPWHWIGGKDNLQRFGAPAHDAQPLADCPEVAIDTGRKLLLTPYPDYRQLSNAVVERIRVALSEHAFYRR